MPRPLAIEDYPDLRRPTALALSPDGERLAFVAMEFDPAADDRRTSLFVVPTDASELPHRLTRASDGGTPRWSPDGTKLGFIAARKPDSALSVGRREDDDEDADGTDGDEEPEPQLWVFDLDRGGDARQITDREWGVREFDWGPDGERVVVSARDPTEDEADYLEERRDDGPIEITRLQHKADGTGWLDDVTTYLFVIELESLAATRLDEAAGAGAYEPLAGLQPAWGPDERIAFLTNRTERPDDSGVYDVHTVRADGSALRAITDGTVRATRPRWSPSGQRLAYIGGHPTNWYVPREVHVAEVDGDGPRVHDVSGELDRTVARNGEPRWADEETLVSLIADEGRERLVRLPVDGRPSRVFDRQADLETVERFDLAGGTLALALSRPTDGRDLFAMATSDLDAGPDDPDPRRRLTALNADLLADVDLPACRRLVFENGDDEPVEALAYLPTDFDVEAPEPRPTVVDVHGGPMSYDAPEFEFDHTLWTGRGYVVLKVNYRGSSSYGRAFCERLRGSRGDLETDDVLSGVDHLIERGWTDPDRLFLTGFSYGGITTAHALTRTDRFTAGAAEHGIYDYYSNFGTDDAHLWSADEFGLPWEELETYRDISSLTNVDRIETPLLITAGEEDWRCPPTQAEQLYVSLRKLDVDAKLVVYPGERHDVGAPERAMHRLRTLAQWFEEHDPSADA